VSSATSNEATLSVSVATVAPSITTQPTSKSVTVGSSVTLSAAASGTPTPSCQWYKNGAAISGATGASYTIASASLSDAATYTMVATNSVSSATSNGATLNVNVATGSAPQITSTTLAGGAISEPFRYTIVASNQPTSYAAAGLPSGLTINTATGVITGSPTDSGTFSVTLRATNGGGTGSATLSLTITPSVAVITFAGNVGASNLSGAMAATATTFSNPSDVAVDVSGNLYVADTNNHVIRKISLSGSVTIVAGQSGISGSADASVATNARFNSPVGLAIDGSGNIFVSDTGNAVIRKISAAGVVTTLAGAAGVSGASDGSGNAAHFNQPSGLIIDSSGNLFVADTANHAIRKITPAGAVTTLAGISGYSGTVDGLAGSAMFNRPADLVVDTLGNLYVADTGNHTIRKVTLSAGYATVSTIAGRAGVIGSADGVGVAALFNGMTGLALDQNGDLYVSDTGNHVIRRVTPATGLVITLAGSAGSPGTVDGFGGNARLSSPMGLAADTTGDIYIADSSSQMIRQIGYYAAPTIQTQPQGQTVANGASASFSVVASGLPTANYQWYKDGAVISGATASTYSLTAAQTTNAGSYTVVISNAMGSVTSFAATLTVSTTTSAGSSTGSSSTSSGSGGGGGGAPSDYYLIVLVTLGLARIFSRKQ
jgi:sugar lactone lactonase YvrE